MRSVDFGLKSLAYALLGLAAIFIVGSILTMQIGLDGGFYLALARNVWEDGVNYFDLASSYNPLGIMILGLPNIFLDNPVQINYLTYFLFLILDTLLFYYICLHYRKDHIQSLLFSSIFLFYALVLDGHLIILEPVQLLFIFASILFIHHKKYVWLGVTFFCAFLTKQYSLALIIPICLTIFQGGHTNKQKLIQFTSTMAIFIASFVVFYFLYARQFSFEYYLQRLLGKVPQMKEILSNTTGTGEGYSIVIFLNAMFKIALYCPLIWLPLLTVKKDKVNFNLLIAALSFSSVLIFAAYFHYFLLILPWMIILLHNNIDLKSLKLHRAIYLLILSPTLFLFVKTARNKYIISQQEKNISEILQSYIPQDSKVYIVNLSMAQYAYCDFNSIDNRMIGYAFPNIIKKEAVINAMTPGTFLIADVGYLQEDEKQAYLTVSDQTNYIIYKKK